MGALSVFEPHNRLSLTARYKYDLDRFSSLVTEYAHRSKAGLSPGWGLGWSMVRPASHHQLWGTRINWSHSKDDTWSIYFDLFNPTPSHVGGFFGIEQVGGRFQPSLGFNPEVNYRRVVVHSAYYHKPRRGNISSFWGDFHFNQRHFCLARRADNYWIGRSSVG